MAADDTVHDGQYGSLDGLNVEDGELEFPTVKLRIYVTVRQKDCPGILYFLTTE